MALRLTLLPAVVVFLAGCANSTTPSPSTPLVPTTTEADHGHDHGSAILVPDLVQKNLGITWATAEYRIVQGVLRLPGRFEADPTARRPYQAPFAGRVEVLVTPYQTVAAGTPLYRLHAPEWQRLQQDLATATGAALVAEDRFQATEAQQAAATAALALATQRLTSLERLDKDLGGQAAERAEAASRVADLRMAVAEALRDRAEAALLARGAGGGPGQAQHHVDLLLAQAAQLTGLTTEALTTVSDGKPRWATLPTLDILAAADGVVEGTVVPSGTWINDRTTVLTVTDPTGVHLQAAGLQGDLTRLTTARSARIVAADPAIAASIPATLLLGPVADARDRSVDLIARPAPGTAMPLWVRPGVTANLEVVIDGSAEEELAIPVAATIRDGLQVIFFRRDPQHPDQVVRVEADLGAQDGRWVVVQSGLKEGDQVVLGGIYPLKLSLQTGGAQAGHFEADGTFHTGKH